MKPTLTLLTALLLVPPAALHAAETLSQPTQPDMERALLQGFAHPPVQFAPGPQYGPDKRNYQGIPTIARAPQGRLWAAWYAGKVWEDKYNYVLAATSGDDGKTWSAPQLVIDPDGDGDRRASDPCFWLDPGGKLWLFWWMNGGDLNVTLAITTKNPNDEHPVWTKPRALFPGVMLNKPTVLKNGDWLMPAAIWNRDDSARVMITKDGGKTFSLLGAANIPAERRNADEHMIVERKDGSLMMLVRTDKQGIGRSISRDGGRTWTGVEDYLPHATSRFFLRRLASGNQLLIKHGPIDKRIDRSELTAYLSEDDGETWKGGLLIDPRKNVSYPDGIQAPDGRIYLIYDWERARDKNILMATVTESDVLARAFSPGGRERVLINHATGVNPKITAKPVTIDLAKRTWQGIPCLERTAKGRVFVSWFTGGIKEPEPENTVVLSHSDDGGKTFSAPQAMALPLSDGTRCYDPCLWIDPKGRLWYLFNRSVKDSTRHGVYARICDDPDATPPVWGAEFRVGFDSPFSFRMNKPIMLSTGEWIMPVVHALEPVAGWAGFDAKQVFGAAISTDEGKTWKLHGAVKTEKAGLENMIVELKDGRFWMLIRTEKVLWESHSSDKGRTWTEGKPTTIATPHSRFFIRRLASGNLLLVNHYKFTGRSHLTAQISTDDGQSWNDGLLLDERKGVSYPDGVQEKDGLIWITYDRDRGGAGEILLAKFKEDDVAAGKNASGVVSLKQVVNKLEKPSLLAANWNPKAAADKVIASLIKVTAPQAKGAHDAEFVCVGDRAYIVEHDNNVEPGHGAGAAQYCVLSIVNLKTRKVEKTIPMAKSEQVFDNVTLPKGMCFVPRIIRKDDHTLRTFFCSQPAKEQAVTWYRDFDLGTQTFDGSIHKAKLKTAAGVFDMEPRHFHADAVAQGFTRKAVNQGLFIFDSFKQFDGRRYVALNNFPGKQNALAVLHDDFTTFEVIGHYNEPQSQQLSESAVNRLPDCTWMAICRNDAGNYHFTNSKDGKNWTVGQPVPFVPNGLNSKPTFDKFSDVYYLGWQENTKVGDCGRSVFNVDVSLDGITWQRKYRFESPHSFQYPTFHEHEGAVWLTVTQSDHKGSTDRIMFGKLEDLPKPAVKVTQELLNSIHVTPKLIFDPMPTYGQKYLPFAMAASMESTSKGRLWTCWAGGQDGPNAYLLASYSDDQGKSWRDPVFVIDPQAHGLRMGTRLGSFWCDPKGRLWLFFHQSVGMFDGSCSNWYVRCDDPDAEKPVWTEPVYIGFGASLNKPIVRKNGEWLLPVSLWERWHIDKPFADCYRELDAVRGADVFVSDDEGGHWRYRGGNTFKDSCFNEHSVVEKQDGTLWMLSRCMKEIAQSFSTDGGKTWQPQTTFFPHVNSKAVFRRLQSGNLLLIKHGQTFETQPNDGTEEWNWGKGRSHLTAFLSTDDGKTWLSKLLLDERHSVSYPDIAQAPNGDIYVHYDRDRTGAAEILFARFREEDAQAGKLISKDAALKNLVKSKLGMNHGADTAKSPKEAK